MTTAELQEAIDKLQHEKAILRLECSRLADKARSLEADVVNLNHELTFWKNRTVSIERSFAGWAPDKLAMTVQISPLLFYTLNSEQRRKLWLEAIHHAWHELVDKSIP